MANRTQGEVSLTVGGVTYTLVLTMAGMIAAEERADEMGRALTWDQIVEQANRGSARAARLFVWAMFHRHHADLTLEQVGDLIDTVGGMAGLHRALDVAQQEMTPDAEDVQALGPRRPPKARTGRGAGARSTARAGRSA